LQAAPGHRSPPEEQARRLLEDGRSARSQGKIKQALDSFGIIVTGFSNTSSIDDALLEIGRTYLEASGETEKARQAFEQVATRYPQGDAAPGAYYYLGRIALDGATNAAELDDALAQFVRLEKVYAGSQWMPRALYGIGARTPPGAAAIAKLSTRSGGCSWSTPATRWPRAPCSSARTA